MTDDFTTAPSPESVGIPSGAILRFLERIDSERIHMHGFLLVRHDQVAAEGYWSPWTAQRKHRMYSVTKSFVSMAVGLMIDEGRLSLDERVADHFPDRLPEPLHPWVATHTVRDLLRMSTAHSRTSYGRDDPDWVATFFQKAPSHPPGTLFYYDTAATVVLTAIVEQLAGAPFLDYMRPRFLNRIGFSEDAWCIRRPEGGSWGGSGLICTLRDLAKVAWTCMKHGGWDGEQLLPEDYVRTATSPQIDNTIRGQHGYGYQIWCDPEGGFSMRGMGSQYAIAFPERDFLFTCNADTQGAPSGTAIPQLMREELLPDVADAPLPADPATQVALREKIESLASVPLPGAATSPVVSQASGTWYDLEDNPMGIKRMRLIFDGNQGTWEYTRSRSEHTLRFGIGSIMTGTFPQRNYFGEQIGVASGCEYECLASAAWVDDITLNMEVLITDIHLGGLRMSIAFDDDRISVYMTKQAEWFLDEYVGFAGGKVG